MYSASLNDCKDIRPMYSGKLLKMSSNEQEIKYTEGLKVFCETIFGFLEQSANRDPKWFSDVWKPNRFTHTKLNVVSIET